MGLVLVIGDGKFVDVFVFSLFDYKFKVIINGKFEFERSYFNLVVWVLELNY